MRSPSRSFDAAVIGAGPAGASAAITLARRGRRVALVDKARFPRDKCCGDGLTTGALRHLEALGLRPADVASWRPVVRAHVRVPDGRVGVFPLPEDGTLYAAAARRMDLDAALVNRARQEGVTVLEGQPVIQATSAAGGALVRLLLGPSPLTPSVPAPGAGENPPEPGDAVIEAPYVVAADGMWSPLRRLLGVDEAGYLGEWHAVRQYFTAVAPAAADMRVWFEPDLLPGYVWSFPLPDGRANVGFGIHRQRQPVGRLKQRWAEILERGHIAEVLGPAASPESAWRSWPIPARIGRSALATLGGRVLFVGDAARATDVLTGEGIAQAFDTAMAAARALDDAGPHRPGRAAARYTREISRGMAVDDRLSRALSRVVASERGANGWLRVADLGGWTRNNFARWMFEDYPRAVLATPRRWHRTMFHQPGAFAAASRTPPAPSALRSRWAGS